jgi:hypothetical protein
MKWQRSFTNGTERGREGDGSLLCFNTSGLLMAWPSADVMPVRSGGMVNTQINDVPGYYVPGMLNPNSKKVNLMPLSA